MIKLRYFIGNDDRLINLIEIKDFFSRVPTEDEELVEIQNGLHECSTTWIEKKHMKRL